MKITVRVSLFVFVSWASAFGQGTLAPPAAPAATMKTLSQIEPRTDVATLSGDASHVFVIAAAGSYYLSGNILAAGVDGILISASNVSLDLNGFSIILSIGSNKKAVTITGNNVTVRNGTIRDWGSSGKGIDATNIGNCRFETLQIINSGTGLTCGARGTVRDCIFDSNAAGLITSDGCLVADCMATNSTTDGIKTGDNSSVTNCVATGNAHNGIYTGSNSTAQNCRGESTGSFTGVYAWTAINCRGSSIGGAGVNSINAINCYGSSTSGVGLEATTATDCIGSSGSGTGMLTTVAANCSGTSDTGDGLSSGSAGNCFGSTAGGAGKTGLIVNGTASYCRGQSTGAATGLNAFIAIGCEGSSTAGTPVTAVHRYLSGMSPDS